MSEDFDDSTYSEKEWVTSEGFHAVVIVCRGSHRCGYVGVPVGHPLHGVNYGDNTIALAPITGEEKVGDRGPISLLSIASRLANAEDCRSPEDVFDVHGSLTFSAGCVYREKPNPDNFWYFGFDCHHCGDGSMNPAYSYSDGPVRSLEYCVVYCESLSRQIKEKTIWSLPNETV